MKLDTVSETVSKTRDETPNETGETSFLREKVKLLEQRIEELRQDKEHDREEYKRREEILQAEKQKLLTLLERSQMQLEDMRTCETVKEEPKSTLEPRIHPQKQQLLIGGLVTAIIILLIVLAFTLPCIDKLYGLGLFSPQLHVCIEALVGKLF